MARAAGETSDGQANQPRVELVDDGGRPALAIDGAVQSVAVGATDAPGGYWAAMLPDVPPRDALLLGLGGGTVAHLLVRAFGPLPIVGVDDDPAVLALARTAFDLDQPHLEIVAADAFAYVAGGRRQFDFVCVDLYRDGAIPARVSAPGFLRDVRAHLRPGGLATFNLARDRTAGNRLRPLARYFVVVRRVLVGFNLVAHCALSPPLRRRGRLRGKPRARPG